jgi:hypothetical protein
MVFLLPTNRVRSRSSSSRREVALIYPVQQPLQEDGFLVQGWAPASGRRLFRTTVSETSRSPAWQIGRVIERDRLWQRHFTRL